MRCACNSSPCSSSSARRSDRTSATGQAYADQARAADPRSRSSDRRAERLQSCSAHGALNPISLLSPGKLGSFRRARRCSMGKRPHSGAMHCHRRALGQRRSWRGYPRDHVRAPRSSRTARMPRSNEYAGSAGPARPWRALCRAAPASPRGAAAAMPRCIRGRPRARRCAETLRRREQRAGLVVQFVGRIARVGSQCRQAGTPARRRQWCRTSSR
jgi:hypothetical protein